MTETGKSKIRQALEAKRQQSEALMKEMGLNEPGSDTITIESLYAQLQSLKHEIDIEVIQRKLRFFEETFSFLTENKAILMELIEWYQEYKAASHQVDDTKK